MPQPTSNDPDLGAVDDRYRPEVHFAPQRNWMNDPNGPIYLDGRFHLYYQYNPNGHHWGDIAWGHAVSDDLVTWEELPVAIAGDRTHMVFSGSAVRTADGVAAFYTGHRFDADPSRVRQDQRLAISRDGGRSFTPSDANPIIDDDLVDFRDPNVSWHEESASWVMVVALPHDRQVVIYTSTNLTDWEETSRFGPAGAIDGIWECPALFELPLIDAGRPAGTRWVLKVDHNPGHVSGGSGSQYFVGEFDGRTFTPSESLALPRWVDWGADFYGALPFHDEPASDTGRTWIAWMSNWDYAHDTPTAPWRGAMTLPRRVALVQRDGRPTLTQSPVDTLDSAGGAPMLHRAGTSAELFDGSGGLEVPDVYRLRLDADLADAERVRARLGLGGGAEVLITYDRPAGTLTVDRSRSGRRPNERFSGIHSAPLAVGGTLRLDVVVDRSSVEVFADDGAVVFTEVVYPPLREHTVPPVGADSTFRGPGSGSGSVVLEAEPVPTGPVELSVTPLGTN